MYFWNIEKLKQTINNGGLSESAQFIYLLIWIILSILAQATYIGDNFNDIKYSFAIDLIFSVLGIIYLYKCNGGSKGNRFVEKYFSIGLVVSIRWFIFVLLPMALIVLVVSYTLYTNSTDEQMDKIFDYIILPISLLVYY